MSDAPDTAYCPKRLRRAAVLAVKRIGPEQFVVRGQDEPFYTVSLACDPPCYCADYYHRGGPTNPCKHILAVRLHSGDSALILALGEMLLKAERHMEEL